MTFLLFSSFVLFLIAGVRSDCACRRIPNLANLGIFLSGAAWQFVQAGGAGLLSGLEGAALGLLLALPFYLFLGLGGGDVKLLAGSGMFLGVDHVLPAAAGAALAGGAMALFFVLVSKWRRLTWRRWRGMLLDLLRFRRPRYRPPPARDPASRRMPFAPALAVGILLQTLQSCA